MPAPIPDVSGCVHFYGWLVRKTCASHLRRLTPVKVLIVFPTRSISDFLFQTPKNACKLY